MLLLLLHFADCQFPLMLSGIMTRIGRDMNDTRYENLYISKFYTRYNTIAMVLGITIN
jgi:hypothetical protein